MSRKEFVTQEIKSVLSYFIASLVTLVAPLLWIGTLLGLPGNWGLVILAVVLAYFAPETMHIDIHIATVAMLTFMAISGEIAEFAAGAAGVNQLGGSRRGAALAVVGSIVGSITGMVVGVPIPIVGSLVAALLFGGVGAFVGAVAGERWAGREWDASIQIGWGAVWGKLLGTLLKTICGTAMMALLIYAVWT